MDKRGGRRKATAGDQESEAAAGVIDMRSVIVKRSVAIRGHKTSVSLEDVFWQALREIAELRGSTLSELLSKIDARRQHDNLSSHIRMYVLDYYRLGVVPPEDWPDTTGKSGLEPHSDQEPS